METNKHMTKKQRKLHRIWKSIRPFCVVVVSVLVVYLISVFSVRYFLSNYINPVDVHDATPIEVVIPESASASRIAQILYNARGEDEKGLITNTAVFKVYVDFIGKASSLQAGTYILSRNMTLKQIVDVICEGNGQKEVVKFTIPEGYTVLDIAKTLLDKNLIPDESKFLSLCESREANESFSFIAQLPESAEKSRTFIMEGYLFPDTYEVYADGSVQAIIIKFVNRFNDVFTEDYLLRAEELGMTVDEVVTLASLIEREAKNADDFGKVSAVFHNRLKEGMKLQSCASLSYILGINKYTFSSSEMETDSLYNTYKYEGLPVGPICNPGETAIRAALYPNQEYLDDGYLYFCNGNISLSSDLVFAKTYEEHQKNVELYQAYWN
ncbi:MAG: endolytic transglycosylase MltG [Clostridia bacterium]|nr:endolytic transglycosylase MltG [Clostridia bacterium]